jgi:alkyldihydroxyacetonephosphate synthase
MRRWNGWGDESIDFPLNEHALGFLAERVGLGRPLSDAPFEQITEMVPDSRLPDHPLVSKTAEDRVRHARGQSLPDWLALRSGRIEGFPDGVAFPDSADDVREILTFAQEAGACVIPYGGGTSVAGHITPIEQAGPALTMDLGRMNRLLDLDPQSQIATFGAGTAGPEVEAQLRANGFTLGHFPQSFEYSTLGGWVATRSSGQQSLRYGRIEQLFAGGRMETPKGTLVIPPFPASSAGPDLRELTLGSEGRLGVLTEVKVRISPLPEQEVFFVFFFPQWEEAVSAVRRVVQHRISLSMLRLSNSAETETQLALADHQGMVALLERILAWRGAGAEKCLLMTGVTGTKTQCRASKKEAIAGLKRAGAVYAGRFMGRKWAQTRFRVPYLRNSLWEKGYVVDTLETAVQWDHVLDMMAAIESALAQANAGRDERLHVFSHLSHVYPTGASIYTTCIFPMDPTHEAALDRWRRLKQAASRAIVALGGTISHQHGVGLDHKPYLVHEKGELGIAALQTLCRQFDPHGIMNPGKLVAGI